MQTNFTPEQLENPDIAQANDILRSCVHCGFCTATCPSYQVLGDELDSPRGRIYLIKDMLESDRAADEKTVTHIDRCLSCLACTTTCPSGVDYMHLVDMARAHIEDTYTRPLPDRLLRAILVSVLPYPRRFRLALRAARIGRWFRVLLPARLRTMIDLAPTALPAVSPRDRAQVFPATGTRRARVALMQGCAQQVLDTDINPSVAEHGGVIRLIDVKENQVFIQMGGGCQGCGQADVTLKFGIENAIRAAVPGVGDILDVTDHASGRNPYYTPSTK